MNSSLSAPNLMITELRDQSSRRNSASKMFEDLKSRKKSLEEKLTTKLEELKELCLKEAELTGSVPEDLLRFFKADELPQMRRRVGTSFILSSKLLNNDLSQADDLTQLEVDYEMQEKLMTALWQLAQKNKSKTIKKKLRQDFREKQIKLKELEDRINKLRSKRGKELLHARSLEGDFSEDSKEFLDDDIDDDVMKMKSLMKHSSASQFEDPDKNSTYSSTSNKSSSSTTSIPDQQQQQQQSPSSGIKFYPKKKLSEPSTSRHKLQHNNSRKSNGSNSGSTVEEGSQKFDRRQQRSSGRVEGRRKSNHFAAPSRSVAGSGEDVASDDHRKLVASNDEWKSKYSSLDRRRKSSGTSKEMKRDEGTRRGSMELPQLTPSKYGSKRDSTLEDDDDDDDDDTLGKHDESISSSACHYLPNSFQLHQYQYHHHQQRHHYLQHPSSFLDGKPDPGIGNPILSTGKSYEDGFDFAERGNQGRGCSAFSHRDSTSSGSSNSLHFQAPLSSRLDSKPSGPDKLTRLVTDVRVVGPRPPVGPSRRNQRNEEAVDALFKHYEEKILPSRIASVREHDDDDGVDKNQSLKIAKPKDYLTSPRTRVKCRGFATRSEFNVEKFLSSNGATLPKVKNRTFRFCSTLV